MEVGLIPLPEIIHEIQSTSIQVLQAIRAQSNLQPKASKLPPLVPVVIDTSQARHGKFLVDNSEKRKQELSQFITEVLESGHLSTHDALKLRGCMQFASGQLYGRAVRLCMALVSNHAYTPGGSRASSELSRSLSRCRDALNVEQPRVVNRSTGSTWLVFTDASSRAMRIPVVQVLEDF